MTARVMIKGDEIMIGQYFVEILIYSSGRNIVDL